MKWDIYVIHHSHTDLGYTDLQERVLYNQVNYIKTATKEAKDGFKWNCETYYCVEQFLENASEEDKKAFFESIKKDNIGISATYLNFNDLVDCNVLTKRTNEMVSLFKEHGIDVKTAMNADVNGISLGSLDSYVDNGIEFLYTNIHTHHGMYPLYQNMTPYYWENHEGKKLLVWNGEHYNLGNALGLVANKNLNFMTQNYFGAQNDRDPIITLKNNLTAYLNTLKTNGYPYSFVPLSVSGVFSDNAPPNPEILENIKKVNALFDGEVNIKMVTLDELYKNIKNNLEGTEVKTYKGDLNDWWANGVGSTPYLVKHYKEAERINKLVHKLDEDNKLISKKFEREYEDNSLIYAEHTWGHSATISDPYDTMVLNLDVRKNSYASKAHEAASKNLLRIQAEKGDIFRYYGRNGKIQVTNPGVKGKKIVEFYIEVWCFDDIEVRSLDNDSLITSQVSKHPRGVLISFIDDFDCKETKTYTFKEVPKKVELINTRKCYVGAERVRDIVNDYETVSYKLPYSVENDFFRISYKINEGVTSFFDKKANKELLKDGEAKFFTPIYEKTEITKDVYEERRLMGRNMRGIHAKKYFGNLEKVEIREQGSVFTEFELTFTLEGTTHCSEVIRMYNEIPQIDFKLKVAKTISEAIESLYLPLDINRNGDCYFDKGNVPFRPGIDQIPGTCNEFYLVSNGLSYMEENKAITISLLDAPLVYTGKLEHHPIELCDNKNENNKKEIYSWIMNNCWETNFKLDLSGITEYRYSLSVYDTKDVKESFETMSDNSLGVLPIVLESF